MSQFRSDLKFAFEKARGQRGISASLMFEVIKMWMWILEDKELAEWEEYYDYGLPYLEKVREKYASNQIV